MMEHNKARGDIMIVDDNPANLKLLEEMLLQRGQEVRSFPLGRLALASAANNPPDLILLDIGLPKLDGFQAAQRILASTPHTRIVFVSQESCPEIIEEALKLGRDFISKTSIITQLLAAVNAVISEQVVVEKT